MLARKAKFLLTIFLAIILIFAFGKFVYSADVQGPAQTVSVSVEPHTSDFQASIASDTTQPVPQYTEIAYTITYGSNLQYSAPLTVEAEWSPGTIQGSPTQVEVVDYVIGSASDAYGGTAAVVDLVNKKITWTISSFPAQTNDQTVTFKLYTNRNYTGSEPVDFTTYARVISSPIILQDQTTNTYQFNDGLITPTPTATTTTTTSTSTTTTTTTTSAGTSTSPTTTTTTTTAPTTTTTPIAVEDKINSVSIGQLSSDKVVFNVLLSKAGTIKLIYGKSLSGLNDSIYSLSPNYQHDIEIDKLTANQSYYAQIWATFPDGKTIKSDIFTFKTPSTSIVSTIDKQSIIITSKNSILVGSSVTAQELVHPVAVIPENTVYQFRFRIDKYLEIKRIQAVLRNSNVLGVSTFGNNEQALTKMVDLMEIEPGIYEGKLKTSEILGSYDIIIRIYDINGNISEQKLSEIKVSRNLTVFKDDEKTPVEGARILISRYNQKTKEYDPLSPQITAISNPSYTDPFGEDNLVLPMGRYKANIMAIGYKTRDINFNIGVGKGQEFPLVYLKAEPFNFLTFLTYYFTNISDFFNLSRQYLQQIAISNRFFELNAASVLLITLILSIIALSMHTKIPVEKLYWDVFNYGKNFFFKGYLKKYIFGTVYNLDNTFPVKNAKIYLIDPKKNEILEKKKTNSLGEFYLNKPKMESYRILVIKKGFDPHPFFDFDKQSIEDSVKLNLGITPDENRNSVKEYLFLLVDIFFAIIIPLLITICLVTEFVFGYSFGFIKVFPFFFVSVLNFVLWARFFRVKIS